MSFAKLGLVVIDEQHKFGVRQRAMLKQAGPDPHYLVMTATPIPRSVTMTLFGDLDVSTLRDSPPGRQKVNTYLANDDQRAKWWDFFRKKLREGRQGFVVTPLVEESEAAEAVSLEETYETLANGELEAFRLGLIHGRMTPAEKDAVMDRFPPRRDPGAGLHVGGRGGRGRAQRHADDDRGRAALRPGPAAPASRADQPRQVSRLLLRLRRSADRGIARAAEGVRRLDRRLRVGRDRFPASRAGRHFRHASSTACRRCGLPICCAISRCWKKPAATPTPW